MNIKRLLLIIYLLITLNACSIQTPKLHELNLSSFKNNVDLYEFTDIPTNSTISEVEKMMGINLEEPDYFMENYNTATYEFDNLYEYDKKPVRLSLKFKENQLQTVMLSFSTEDITPEELFSDIANSFIQQYGEQTDMIENSGNLSEFNNSTFQSKIMRWDAFTIERKTTLQLILMIGDKVKPTVSIGVGDLP